MSGCTRDACTTWSPAFILEIDYSSIEQYYLYLTRCSRNIKYVDIILHKTEKYSLGFVEYKEWSLFKLILDKHLRYSKAILHRDNFDSFPCLRRETTSACFSISVLEGYN